jgi:hypothetical protein
VKALMAAVKKTRDEIEQFFNLNQQKKWKLGKGDEEKGKNRD